MLALALTPLQSAWGAAERLSRAPSATGVLPPESMPYGMSYGEWSALWWNWGMGQPAESNPIADPDGSFCGVGQSGPVWFLAGAFGGSTIRSCTIPSGKAIFFPIVNLYVNFPCGCPACAVPGLDPSQTGPSNVVFDPCILPSQPAFSDGYWVMLAPLSVGNHTLYFRGAGMIHLGDPNCTFDFPFEVQVTYNLTVTGRHGRGQISADDAVPTTWGTVKNIYR